MTKNEFYETVRPLIKMDSYCNFKIVGSQRTYRIKPGSISYRVERKLSNGDWYNLTWGKVLYYKNTTPEKVVALCNKLITLSETEPKKKEN